MKRIAIMGCSGSGKSTLARALGERLDLPVYHLDVIFWQPGWVEGDYETFTPKVQEILAQDKWIIDGGYSKSDPDERRFKDVDVFVFFERSVWLCLWRVMKRVLQYRNRVRPDMGEGCPEKVDWEFLAYIWNYKKSVAPIILERAARNETAVIFVRKDPNLDVLIEELTRAASART